MQLFITCTEIEHQLHHYAFFTIRAGVDKRKKDQNQGYLLSDQMN